MKASIIYSNLAPFHFARLETAGRWWDKRSSRLSCVEIAREQSNYLWGRSEYVSDEFDSVTLFEDRDLFELKYPAVRRSINEALNQAQPDVVVINGWGHKHSAAALGWCCRRGIPRVVVSDSQEIDLPRRPWKESVKKSFVGQCHSGFAGGAPQVRYLESLGLPAEFCVVGCDVIDNEMFARKNGNGYSDHRDDATLHLLSCLRFIESKNIPRTLEAMASLHLPWRWTLAGYGPEEANILRCVEKLGLRNRVHLPGHVPYEGLPPLFASADVYLQPSLSEPWGLAVNEAMAAGLPVVVSRQCGCREDLVREGVNGFLFEPESKDDLIRVLERMWKDKSRWAEMSKASREIIDHWSLDLFAQNLWRACELAIERARRTEKQMSLVGGLCKLL